MPPDPPRRERLRRSIVTLRLLSNYFQLLQNLWTTLEKSVSKSCTVHYVRTNVENDMTPINYKCWLCKNSIHWPDQCPKLAALSIDDQLKMANKRDSFDLLLRNKGSLNFMQHHPINSFIYFSSASHQRSRFDRITWSNLSLHRGLLFVDLLITICF